MKGYFISTENAKTLGLLDLKSFHLKSQKTIIVITENDIKYFRKKAKLCKKNINDNKINDISSWFYKNYYDSLMESLNDF